MYLFACNASVDCTFFEVAGWREEDAFGFGFLFEKQEDINHFATYVHQHHFSWPSLSTSGMIAYPTMAMASYFEAMVYNLKLVGSLAANRGLNMGDLWDKYKSDWKSTLRSPIN